MNYNYNENVKEDIKEYLKENYTKEEVEGFKQDSSDLYDILFMEDSITGNASGSYYCNTWKSEEAICHNLDLLAEALESFGCEGIDYLNKGAEWCDVSIRCYVLGQVLDDAISEFLEESEEE